MCCWLVLIRSDKTWLGNLMTQNGDTYPPLSTNLNGKELEYCQYFIWLLFSCMLSFFVMKIAQKIAMERPILHPFEALNTCPGAMVKTLKGAAWHQGWCFNIASENRHLLSVDWPVKNDDFPWRTVGSPEGQGWWLLHECLSPFHKSRSDLRDVC